jgi:hypothetical protein
MIVVAALGVLVTPYLLPEPSGPYESASWSVVNCTRFAMATKPVTAAGTNKFESHWIGSITVSNVGPHAAELLGVKIISRTRIGTESWPIPLGNRLLRRGSTTIIDVQLPADGETNAEPRVWELHGDYKTRLTKWNRWLTRIQHRLPSDLRILNLAQVCQGSFSSRFPENYDSMLTNELGWRSKVISLGVGGRGISREWRPAIEEVPPQKHQFLKDMISKCGTNPVVVTARVPDPSIGPSNNAVGKMAILRGEFAFYVGQPEYASEEIFRIRAPEVNGNCDFVEVRTADILGWTMIYGDTDAAISKAMERWLGRPDGSARGNRPIQTETNRTSSAADSRR